jgi:hypothetical protein
MFFVIVIVGILGAVGIEALLLDQIEPRRVLGHPLEHQVDDLRAALSPGRYLVGDFRDHGRRPFQVIARIHVPGKDAPSHASEISPPLVQSSLTWDFLHRNFNTPRASSESEGDPGITCIALIGSTFGLPATVAIALLLIA